MTELAGQGDVFINPGPSPGPAEGSRPREGAWVSQDARSHPLGRRQVPGGGSMDEGWNQVAGQVHSAEPLSSQSSNSGLAPGSRDVVAEPYWHPQHSLSLTELQTHGGQMEAPGEVCGGSLGLISALGALTLWEIHYSNASLQQIIALPVLFHGFQSPVCLFHIIKHHQIWELYHLIKYPVSVGQAQQLLHWVNQLLQQQFFHCSVLSTNFCLFFVFLKLTTCCTRERCI